MLALLAAEITSILMAFCFHLLVFFLIKEYKEKKSQNTGSKWEITSFPLSIFYPSSFRLAGFKFTTFFY